MPDFPPAVIIRESFYKMIHCKNFCCDRLRDTKGTRFHAASCLKHETDVGGAYSLSSKEASFKSASRVFHCTSSRFTSFLMDPPSSGPARSFGLAVAMVMAMVCVCICACAMRQQPLRLQDVRLSFFALSMFYFQVKSVLATLSIRGRDTYLLCFGILISSPICQLLLYLFQSFRDIQQRS